MIFSLDVRRARKGDCLLLHFGTKAKPGVVMIDGGPKSVYLPFLKPRLLEIRKARGLTGQLPLPVDRLMVSHVDDDHIQGILDLTRELREAAGTPPLVRIAGLWHNSFDDIIGKDPKELTAAVASQFGTASLHGELPPQAAIDLRAGASDEQKEVARASLKVLASIPQGRQLRGDAAALGIALNPDCDGKLILGGKKEIKLAPEMSFLVAGPMVPELKALQKMHDAWLKTQKKLSGPAALAAYVDDSVPNLSSIVMLARAGGKSMLLTGDARGDKILQGLEASGAMVKGGKMHVDVLKVPHHGSANNLADDFFERIAADHYVFSGNGENGNPERESLAMLFNARGKQPLRVHLTYPITEIDVARKADWNMQQAKEKEKKQAGGKGTVREDWSPAKHGLAAFFEKQKLSAGQKIDVVDAKKPHVIDLLDPLGF